MVAYHCDCLLRKLRVLFLSYILLFSGSSAISQELPDLEWQELSQCYVAPIPEGFDQFTKEEQNQIAQSLLEKLGQQVEGTILKRIIKELMKELGSATAANIVGVFLGVIWQTPTVGYSATSDFLLYRDGQFTGSEIEIDKPYMMVYVYRPGDWLNLPQSFDLKGWHNGWATLNTFQLLTPSEESQLLSSNQFYNLYVPKSPLILSDEGKYRVEGTVFDAVRDVTPPQVLQHSASGAVDGNIYVTFSEEVDPTTLTNTNITIVGTSTGHHDCSYSFDQLRNTLLIDPSFDFAHGETARISISSSITDLAGNFLSHAYEFSYQIETAPKFPISTWAGRHGTIDNFASVGKGEDIAISATPYTGYQVDKWYLDGSVVQEGGNSYALSNIETSHSVGVTFRELIVAEIAITSPNGGELFALNKRMPITWSWRGRVGDSVKLVLVANGFVNTIIATSTRNDGSFMWRIPSSIVPGTNFAVRIESSENPAAMDETDAVFEIATSLEVPDWIEVNTIEDLQAISRDAAHPRDARCRLNNNIDASGFSFQPIGTGYDNYFRGVLDGQGFEIAGLRINRPTESYIGLFSVLMDAGTIKNLRISDHGIYGLSSVGMLVGECAGTIVNCQVTVDDLEGRGGSNIGGMVGVNTGSGVILNCSMSCTASGDIEAEGSSPDNIGGLVGLNVGLVKWCKTEGTIDAWSFGAGKHGDGIGGVVGTNYGMIAECESNCRWIEGEDWTGGIVGVQANGSVVDCYAKGDNVDGDIGSGGIVGKCDGESIDRCFVSVGCVDANTDKGALVGRHYGSLSNSFWCTCTDVATGTGPGSVSQCRNLCDSLIYQSPFSEAGWDFQGIWVIDDGVAPPILRGIGDTLLRPDGLIASSDNYDGVHLSWNSVAYSIAGGWQNALYTVLRSDVADQDADMVEITAWQTGTAAVDESAQPEVTYFYWVKAAATPSGARESHLSGPVSGSRAQPPAPVPTDLACSDGFINSVLLEWNATDANYYQVYRTPLSALRAGIAGRELFDVSDPVAGWQGPKEFVDIPPTAEGKYVYSVASALDSNGFAASPLSTADTGYYSNADDIRPAIDVSIVPAIPISTQPIFAEISASDNNKIDSVLLHWHSRIDLVHVWANLTEPSCSLSIGLGVYDYGDTLTYWAEAVDASANRSQSNIASVIIREKEVSPPIRPMGLLVIPPETTVTFLTGGSTGKIAEQIEYKFYWGDSTESSWGYEISSHSWDTSGLYDIYARARLAEDTVVESPLSSALLVSVTPFYSISGRAWYFTADSLDHCPAWDEDSLKWHTGIQGVSVLLHDSAAANIVAQATTDSCGNYMISVPSGSYWLGVSGLYEDSIESKLPQSIQPGDDGRIQPGPEIPRQHLGL
jgi:hypothetical protein